MEEKIRLHYFYKITAIWAASECFLGGFLHAIKLPFSGLVLGSLSVFYCAFLAYRLGAQHIWKATLIVLIIKAGLSPHSPPAAYLAVAFQGSMAALILRSKSAFIWKTSLLGLLVLIESAFQKLIVLTIIYGFGFWQAVEEFARFLMDKTGHEFNFSLPYLLIVYLIVYTTVGLLVGYRSGKIIMRNEFSFPMRSSQEIQHIKDWKSNKRKLSPLLLIWVVLLVIMIINQFISTEIFSIEISRIIFRAAILLGLWYWVAGPLLLKAIRFLLATKAQGIQKELETTLLLLPYIQQDIFAFWQSLSELPKWKRNIIFIKNLPEKLIWGSQ